MNASKGTPDPEPKTSAMLTFEKNLESIVHMAKLSVPGLETLRQNASQVTKFVAKTCEQIASTISNESTRPQAKVALGDLRISLDRLNNDITTTIGGYETMTLWQLVMLVTCIEVYLQDVLTLAARTDPQLMHRSEQHARYEDIVAATSLETLAGELRSRWARNWLSEGGPTRWIERLTKMGARGYPQDLASRLERFWGIRHVVVHSAGIATADFVKRHPGAVKTMGDRVRFSGSDFLKFVSATSELVEPTDLLFIARYPTLVSA